MVQDTLTAAEADDLAVLSDRVAPYEAMTHAIPLPSDADLLQHLLDARGVTPPEVAQATGIGAAPLAAGLAGTHHLTREQIDTLARYFQVASSVLACGE